MRRRLVRGSGFGLLRWAGWLFFLAASALSAATTPYHEPVRIFLRDGRFIRAQALPEIRDGRAWIRTYPGGMLASVRVEELDLEATQSYQESLAPAEEEEAPSGKPRGTVSGGAAPDRNTPSAAVESHPMTPAPTPWVTADEEADKEIRERFSRPFTELSIRQENLMRQVGELHVQQRELERETRRYLFNQRLAGALAKRLRAVEVEISAREKELREVQADLHALLNQAAAEAAPVRRLDR